MNSLPLIGERISYSGQLGTVKYYGKVDNTTGTWLGIEWDNPNRGKHDGVKDGKRYFSCRNPNAGSFIRPSIQVIRGISFLQALKAKYVEEFYGSTSQEKVTLGSSNGAIEVEAVNLDKIRNKFANLRQLREVSLENEHVSRVDEPRSIRETCPNIRGLDLSASLIPTWSVIADIAVELPVLQRLALNRNRFAEVPLDTSKMSISFLNLTDLQLNGSLIGWHEVQRVTSFMPKLVSIELGSNQLCELEDSATPSSVHSSIRNINLEDNKCREWTRICWSLSIYIYLERVILTSNEICCIPPPANDSQLLKELKHISLSSNNLEAWNDLDALSLWCPALSSLSIIGNPLVEIGSESRYSRPFIIARIPTLSILDSTAVTSKERTDSELLYLSYISQRFGLHERIAQLKREHSRWEELSKKHGATLTTSVSHQDRLSRKLVEVQVQKTFASAPSETTEFIDPTMIRMLPSMSLKVLEHKIRKALDIEKDSSCSLWLKMNDGTWAELSDNSRDLDWLGLEVGSQVICCVTK
ncbi:hypothetical protein J3R30DRAFT_3376039 [Lentinula aciculospora]|uniref:U2 small nuclear ribonucleoprotein A' n=1 Tax=Lentinula aciculospora TaxID=153920 RepID=A0A9W9A6J9_9AGAR|nr:hypothetical protein J3R30DRAFT_3376039 [Lentinula aciculospora]